MLFYVKIHNKSMFVNYFIQLYWIPNGIYHLAYYSTWYLGVRPFIGSISMIQQYFEMYFFCANNNRLLRRKLFNGISNLPMFTKGRK